MVDWYKNIIISNSFTRVVRTATEIYCLKSGTKHFQVSVPLNHPFHPPKHETVKRELGSEN